MSWRCGCGRQAVLGERKCAVCLELERTVLGSPWRCLAVILANPTSLIGRERIKRFLGHFPLAWGVVISTVLGIAAAYLGAAVVMGL